MRVVSLVLFGLASSGLLASVAAQSPDRKVLLEVRGGLNIPTFKIADAAKVGPSGGFGLGFKVGQRWLVQADADFGTHDLKGTGGGDIAVSHFIGKVGYVVSKPGSKWHVAVNLGAGALSFNPSTGPTDTYFAINAGAKLGYQLGRGVEFLLSPQGDIAFSDSPKTSWIWPVAAGFRFSF